MNLQNKVVEESSKVCKEFWKIWAEICSEYPDTEDAIIIKILVMRSVLVSLLMAYLDSFVTSDREEQLDQIFDCARTILEEEAEES